MYTEAGLRVGRSIEATLYALARANCVDLQDKMLPELKAVKDKIRQAEVRILRNNDLAEVQQLAEASKLLSIAIAKLSRSTSANVGEFCDEAKKPNSLLGELISALEQNQNKEAAQKLRTFQPLLGKLTEHRNTAAHAALDGNPREIGADDFGDFAESTAYFIERSLQLLIGASTSATK